MTLAQRANSVAGKLLRRGPRHGFRTDGAAHARPIFHDHQLSATIASRITCHNFDEIHNAPTRRFIEVAITSPMRVIALINDA